jgi:hypothetical protein
MEKIEIMKKKFLIITSLIVLFIAVVGFWAYNVKLKPDPEIQQQLDDQFGAGFFNFNDETVFNNSGAAKGADNRKSTDELNTNKDIITFESVLKKIGQVTSPMDKNIAANQATPEEITAKYQSQLYYLQNTALSRIDTLYSTAIQEYLQRTKAGTLNRSELAKKYLQAGRTLEANVDSQFYSTLNSMRAELIANNFSTDIIGVIKAEYEKAKSAKRSQLLAKVLK